MLRFVVCFRCMVVLIYADMFCCQIWLDWIFRIYDTICELRFTSRFDFGTLLIPLGNLFGSLFEAFGHVALFVANSDLKPRLNSNS